MCSSLCTTCFKPDFNFGSLQKEVIAKRREKVYTTIEETLVFEHGLPRNPIALLGVRELFCVLVLTMYLTHASGSDDRDDPIDQLKKTSFHCVLLPYDNWRCCGIANCCHSERTRVDADFEAVPPKRFGVGSTDWNH